MKHLLAILLTCVASMCAQPKPSLGFGNATVGFHWVGPKTVYPGHTTYFVFSEPRYRVPVTCSTSPANTCE